MSNAKRKNFLVCCELDFDANKIRNVVIKSNKAQKAVQQAIAKLTAEGFFHVSVRSCYMLPD